jgi:hypothetical protein
LQLLHWWRGHANYGKDAGIHGSPEIWFANCTKSGHPPVRQLHSIERQENKVTQILLTLKLERVKTQSFFDTF